MALDGIYLSLLRKEFDPLIDGRVDKIHQPSREELIMTIRTKEGAQKLQGADALPLGRTALSVYFSLTLKPPTKWATG